MIDLIGDIHGHADTLEKLLQKLGYTKTNNYYSHPERTAIFVGDYIDRGPKIKETLEIVKQMVDNGSAIALMGNHEYNAICFNTPKPGGGYLRKHSIQNIIQHFKTLEQFKNEQKEYVKYIEWFKTLPLFYEKEILE
ncbi:MAG: metallophosphoesterase [Ginsengibacter sp.]